MKKSAGDIIQNDVMVVTQLQQGKYHLNLKLYLLIDLCSLNYVLTPTNLKHIEEAIIMIPETSTTTIEEYRHNELDDDLYETVRNKRIIGQTYVSVDRGEKVTAAKYLILHMGRRSWPQFTGFYSTASEEW